MKTKDKKQKELKETENLIEKSEGIIFLDISKIPTANLNRLRQILKNQGGRLLVIKKRLLELGLKEKNINLELDNFKTSLGAVFASNFEPITQKLYKFLKELEKEKILESADSKILAGYDFKNLKELTKEYILLVGNLPSREVALAQLLNIILAPIRSLMYILNQKTQRS